MDYWSEDVVSEKFATWNVELVDTLHLKDKRNVQVKLLSCSRACPKVQLKELASPRKAHLIR